MLFSHIFYLSNFLNCFKISDATSNLNAQRERHERELAEAKAQVAAVEAAKAAELDTTREEAESQVNAVKIKVRGA